MVSVMRLWAGGYIVVVVDLGADRAPESFTFRDSQLADVLAFEEWIVATVAMVTGGRVRLEPVKRGPAAA
ncbi:MAG TPA: hypothetical protein VF041_23155 [Gemmatimonadaceae bacterium]